MIRRLSVPQTRVEVVARVLPSGAVRLSPRTQKAWEWVEKLSYVRRAGSSLATWWGYIPDLKRNLGRFLSFTPDSAHTLRRLVDRIKTRDQGRDAEILSLFQKDRRPYHYQLKGIHTGLNCERLLLADDVGLGKTPQSIGVMLAAFKRGLIDRAVIICPASLKQQWYEELHEFAAREAIPGRVAVVHSKAGPAGRKALYKSNWKILIINPELILRDLPYIERFAKQVGFTVLDEASAIVKNAESKIAQALKTHFRSRFRIALTATPVENALADLYSIFEWLDPRIFLSRGYFNRRYVIWKRVRFTVYRKKGGRLVLSKLEPSRYHRLDEVRRKILPVFLRRRVEDVGMELPELIVQWDKLEMPPRQRKVYDSCKRDAIKRLRNLRGTAKFAPLIACRQACDSTALVMKSERKTGHVKIDRLKEMLRNELAGEQVIVFTDYERFVRIMQKELAEFSPIAFTGKMTKTERDRAMGQFKTGARRLFLMTKAGERGHNLQMGSVVINVDLPWNPAALKQRIGRIRRLKSKHKVVRVINMVVDDTIETKLLVGKIYSKRRLWEGLLGDDELTKADPIEKMPGASLAKFL